MTEKLEYEVFDRIFGIRQETDVTDKWAAMTCWRIDHRTAAAYQRKTAVAEVSASFKVKNRATIIRVRFRLRSSDRADDVMLCTTRSRRTTWRQKWEGDVEKTGDREKKNAASATRGLAIIRKINVRAGIKGKRDRWSRAKNIDTYVYNYIVNLFFIQFETRAGVYYVVQALENIFRHHLFRRCILTVF